MIAIRHTNQTTTQNAQNLIEIIRHPATLSVTLFASPSTMVAGYTDTDGPDTNLPLISALAKIDLPGFDTIHLVYDGLFMTAARRPRFHEVVDVMNAAQDSGKAWFCGERLQSFTSQMLPWDAAQYMLKAQPQSRFDQSTRAKYFSLLSTLSESEYERLTKGA